MSEKLNIPYEEQTSWHWRQWHRTDSLARFIGYDRAKKLKCIDIDFPLFILWKGRAILAAWIELAENTPGNQNKPDTIIGQIGHDSDVPAYVVLYTLSDQPNPADPGFLDVKCLRVRQVYPERTGWYDMTPLEYCEFEERVRDRAVQKEIDRHRNGDEYAD